jgi:transcriptional regulator with XRE-family HTH domain
MSVRQERKMNQSEFAELLGMSPSAYARLKRNETQTDFQNLIRFSEILNVPIHEFIPELNAYHNYHQQGVGGGTVFGNQSINYYASPDDATQQLTQENQFLQEKIRLLEEQLAMCKSLAWQIKDKIDFVGK